MKFTDYALYEVKETIDELGNIVSTKRKVATISVSISTKLISQISNDVLYEIKSLSGLTKYSNFNEKSKYFISKDNKTYNIKTFILGRLTQLSLEEVLK